MLMSTRRLHARMLAVLLVAPGFALAGPLTPLAPSELVTLTETNGASCPQGGYRMTTRIDKNGGFNTNFTIPAGKVFIPTSIDVGMCLTATDAGNLASVDVWNVDANGAGLYMARPYFTLGNNGCGGTNFDFTGVVIAAGRQVCIRGSGIGTPIFLHGYLTADR